jgi:arsenate reductase
MPADSRTKAETHGPVIKVFGNKNCDTCRQALKWLESRQVPHRFHDVRERTPDAGLVRLWCESPFATLLVNRRSTTWRSLSGQQRAAALGNPAPAILAHPTLLKRPLFMAGAKVIAVGFSPDKLADYV